MAYRLIQEYTPSDIQDFRSLKGRAGHFEKGLFIAEGEKVTRKMLESSIEIPSAYMTEEHFTMLQFLFEQRNNRMDTTDIFIAEKAEMEQVVGYHLHQGVMLACRIPKNRALEEVVTEWKSPWTAIALDGIADAENMGAIIRNAAAFGAKAVIVDGQSCNPYMRRSVRVSMGTIIDVEIIVVEDIAASLKALRHKSSIRRVGAAISEDSIDLATLDGAGNTIIVFGSEGWGLRKEVIEACDVLARIPMAPGVDSLNVAMASAVFLYSFSATRNRQERE